MAKVYTNGDDTELLKYDPCRQTSHLGGFLKHVI